MSALGILIVSIILISLLNFIPRLINFIKFSLMMNKIPGPAPFPIPYVGLLGWTIKAEGRRENIN